MSRFTSRMLLVFKVGISSSDYAICKHLRSPHVLFLIPYWIGIALLCSENDLRGRELFSMLGCSIKEQEKNLATIILVHCSTL